MAKHLHAVCRRGHTFGMDVDGRRASAVLNKVIRMPYDVKVGDETYTNYKYGIKSNQIASLMGEAAWLVTELKDFTKVQIDDSAWYEVIYD